jgi:hypothetical protein
MFLNDAGHTVLSCLLFALPLCAHELEIASVPPEYTMHRYIFEGEPETGRARVVLQYTWPDYVSGRDKGPGPHPLKVQPAGLRYDATKKAVVYESQESEAVCATLRPHQFLWWKWSSMSPTGRCVVNSREVEHVEDTGWTIRRHAMTDSFLEVR